MSGQGKARYAFESHTHSGLGSGGSGSGGTSIYSGSGSPTSSIGVAGDFYVDTTNKVFWGPKVGSTWPSSFSLAGTPGAAGATGPAGAAGAAGTNGTNGAAATVTVGATSVGVAGTNPVVTNSGTSTNAILNFTIPRGATGATGPQGPAGTGTGTGTSATIAVGTTTTGAAGTSASVTNSGTSSAAVFNFTIPRGADGAGSGGSSETLMYGVSLYRQLGIASAPISNTVGDPYAAGNPNRTYALYTAPAAATSHPSLQGFTAASTIVCDVNPVTSDSIICLPSGYCAIGSGRHYYSSSSYVDSASSEASLNAYSFTNSPRRQKRVFYIRQDATGSRQVLFSPVPNGGQPYLDLTANAVTRVELEFVSFEQGWTLVSAPAVGLNPSFTPSGPQWYPFSGLTGTLGSRVNGLQGWYHRDTPSTWATNLLRRALYLSDNMIAALGYLPAYVIGTSVAYKTPQPSAAIPQGSISLDIAASGGSYISPGSAASEYILMRVDESTADPASVASSTAGFGQLSSGPPPDTTRFYLLHEYGHVCDTKYGIQSAFWSSFWASNFTSRSTTYGTPATKVCPGAGPTAVAGTRVAGNTYALSNAAEGFAQAFAALYCWVATGNYAYLWDVFGCYVTYTSSTGVHWWIDTAADNAVNTFVTWMRTNVDSSIPTYFPAVSFNYCYPSV